MRAEVLMNMETMMEVTTETLTLKLMNESVGFTSYLASTSFVQTRHSVEHWTCALTVLGKVN